MSEIIVRPIEETDRAWLSEVWTARWGGPLSVSRGRAHTVDGLSGFIAEIEGQPAGHVTLHVEGDQCEIVTFASEVEGMGIGSALVEAAASAARRQGCRRLWLITTNDNTPALRFYQKRGFVLAALHRDAIAESRKIKPSISLIGLDGIPIRDEIELEMLLD